MVRVSPDILALVHVIVICMVMLPKSDEYDILANKYH